MAMFQSRREQWRSARAFIDEFCEEAGISRDVCLRCRLVLEELFLNTVKHGHQGGSDAPIWIRFRGVDSQLSIAYEDQAPAVQSVSRGPRGDRGADREGAHRRRTRRDPHARPRRHGAVRVPLRPQPHPPHRGE
jgi:anti-sigma regulatory factor (Ser/Thr protein kinase)